MILRDGVFTGLIVRGPIDGAELSLAGDAALELSFHFSGGALLQRVGAGAQKKGAGQGKSHRKALHPLILEKGFRIARNDQEGAHGYDRGGLL
jgi:hypothetical protein